MNTTSPEPQAQQCYERRIPAAWRDIKHWLWMTRRRWQERRLYRLLNAMESDSNIVDHIKREVPPGCGDGDSMQDAMRAHLIRMGQLFSIEGHSGFSANYAANVLSKLLKFEPLGPLTGEPDEWMEVHQEDDGTPVYQNLRCSHVFKRGDQAYDLDGRIFREPSGACFTSRESRVDITFPYTPTREYVDVEADHDE